MFIILQSFLLFMNDRMIEHRLVLPSVHKNANSCISTQSALNVSISIFQLVVLVLYIIPSALHLKSPQCLLVSRWSSFLKLHLLASYLSHTTIASRVCKVCKQGCPCQDQNHWSWQTIAEVLHSKNSAGLDVRTKSGGFAFTMQDQSQVHVDAQRTQARWSYQPEVKELCSVCVLPHALRWTARGWMQPSRWRWVRALLCLPKYIHVYNGLHPIPNQEHHQ